MKIVRAEAFLACLPLRRTVRHALAERHESLVLFVRLEDELGNEGWGEGVPRAYVTGEEPQSAFDFLSASILPRLVGLCIDDPDAVLPTIERALRPRPGTQSSYCAAELALIDLAGRCFHRSSACWFGGLARGTVSYAAVLPLLSQAELGPYLDEVRALGPRHIKIKAKGGEWPERLAAARRTLGNEVTISVDANGSWDLDEATRYLHCMEREDVAWVEQPLARGREADIPELAARTNIPIMADESLTTVEEAERLISEGGYRIFNLRLSKLGGMACAHRIALLAAEEGLRVQVGCMVGESSILSAAGRLLAASLPEIAAVEGSFGERLLVSDIAEDSFGFGAGGEAVVQIGRGLAVEVRRERVVPLTIRSTVREMQD